MCSFLLIDRVSAANLVIDYDHDKMQYLDKYKYIVDELVNIADTYNTHGYSYVINYVYVPSSSYDTSVYPYTHEYANNTYSGYAIQVGVAGATNDYFSYRPYYSTSVNYVYQNFSLGGSNYQALWNNGGVYFGFTEYFTIFLGHAKINEQVLNQFYDAFKFYLTDGKKVGHGLKDQFAISKPNLNLLDNEIFMVLAYANLPIKFEQEYSKYNDTLTINDTTYYYGDTIPTYYDYAYTPKTPQITTSIENTLLDDNNEVLQKKISINWGIKNQSMYKYMFRTSPTDNWKYFFSEDLTDEILVNKNGSYIFQVTDLDDNYITSTSVTVTEIKEQLPTIKFDDYTGQGCYYNNQQICAILTLYSDDADFSKYTLQYRFLNGEWITHNYENSAKGQIQIYENTSILARLIRNSDNELIDSASYTITKINNEILVDKPTFKFEKPFCTNLDGTGIEHEIGNGNYKQTLKMTIYGLDMTKYRVFISEQNANNFTEITQFEYEDRVPLVKYYYFEYYTDTHFFVKITDLNGNYVTGTSYTLHFDCNDVNIQLGDINDMNDVFKSVRDFFKKFKDIMLKIKEVIEYFYNSLNSEIKAFILTAFILIIALNLIMRMMK